MTKMCPDREVKKALGGVRLPTFGIETGEFAWTRSMIEATRRTYRETFDAADTWLTAAALLDGTNSELTAGNRPLTTCYTLRAANRKRPRHLKCLRTSWAAARFALCRSAASSQLIPPPAGPGKVLCVDIEGTRLVATLCYSSGHEPEHYRVEENHQEIVLHVQPI